MLARTPRPSVFFFFNDTATTEIYTLSLHDALPICPAAGLAAQPGHVDLRDRRNRRRRIGPAHRNRRAGLRSEEHTSELQSHLNLVCRLLLEKKKNKKYDISTSGTTHTQLPILDIRL